MVEGPGDSFRSGTGKVPTPIGTKALSAGRPRCLPRRPQAPLPARGTPCPAQSRLHLSSELRLYTGAGPLQGLGVNTHTSDPVSQALSASPPSPVLQSQHLRWEDEEEDRPPGVEKRGYNNQRAQAPSPAPPRLAAVPVGTTVTVVTAYKLTCAQSSPPAGPQDQGSTCVTGSNQCVDTFH